MNIKSFLFVLSLFAASPALLAASDSSTALTHTEDAAKSEILAAVNAWAQAWSSRDLNAYLAAYSPEFTPQRGARDRWEKQRDKRISKRTTIDVELRDQVVEMQDERHATVRFEQLYKSNRYRDKGLKTLRLVKADDKWLIAEEMQASKCRKKSCSHTKSASTKKAKRK